MSSYTAVQTTSISSAAQVLFPVPLIGSSNVRDPCHSKPQSKIKFKCDNRTQAFQPRRSIPDLEKWHQGNSDILYIYAIIFIIVLFSLRIYLQTPLTPNSFHVSIQTRIRTEFRKSQSYKTGKQTFLQKKCYSQFFSDQTTKGLTIIIFNISR